MDEMNYHEAATRYNASLRCSKYQEAIDSLIVMAAINLADDMPNDAMRCMIIALCLQLTKRLLAGSIDLRIADGISDIRKRASSVNEYVWRRWFTEIGEHFEWTGAVTLLNALMIFQYCVEGEYEKANAYLGALSSMQFDE